MRHQTTTSPKIQGMSNTKTIEFGLSITQGRVRHNACQTALQRVKKLKNIQVKDQIIKDNKKSLHTQVYTVEMGKYTKINKEKKNKLQGK